MRIDTLIVIGSRRDPHVQFISESIKSLDVYIFDYNELPRVSVDPVKFKLDGREFYWGNVIVLWRMNFLDRSGSTVVLQSKDEEDYWREQWNEVINYIGGKVPVEQQINQRGLAHRAGSKIFLADFAERAGIRFPRSCVSNCVKELTEFQNGSDLVYKRLGSRLVSTQKAQYTLPVKQDIRELESSVSIAPNLLQYRVDGNLELRVLVIGDHVFVIEISTDKISEIDWRRSQHDQSIYRLSENYHEVQAASRRFCEAASIDIAAIDFMIDEDGDPLIVDCNPFGQFLFIDAFPRPALAKAFDALAVSKAS